MSMMEQMMSGAGGAPPPPGDLPALGEAAGQPGGSQTPAELEKLNAAAQAMHEYIAIETDPQDQASGAKILALIQGMLGGREKEQDAALGISPALKFVQRQQRSASPASQGY